MNRAKTDTLNHTLIRRYNALFVGKLSGSSGVTQPSIVRLSNGVGGEFGNVILANVGSYGVERTQCGAESTVQVRVSPLDFQTHFSLIITPSSLDHHHLTYQTLHPLIFNRSTLCFQQPPPSNAHSNKYVHTHTLAHAHTYTHARAHAHTRIHTSRTSLDPVAGTANL